ncbi:YegP family protein [Photobacterium sanguinicancri]|uniref:YegP family protein n=1 Tax=Photobacterium sanguinicancri TaxID=875932 RepID=A0AAW7YBJ2_9GAMM|nr:YegP family protein [Photobacterium sanguinicancri]MDO6544015.1 YegP family protein [Photobacterium sanguinicancri]
MNAIERKRFTINTVSDGQFYFNLKANNHQVIGTSEMYTAVASAKEGIHSVQFSGHSVQIEDQTV